MGQGRCHPWVDDVTVPALGGSAKIESKATEVRGFMDIGLLKQSVANHCEFARNSIIAPFPLIDIG